MRNLPTDATLGRTHNLRWDVMTNLETMSENDLLSLIADLRALDPDWVIWATDERILPESIHHGYRALSTFLARSGVR